MTTTTAQFPTQIDAILSELRGVIDRREQLAEEDRRLSKRREQLEAALRDYHAQSGLLKLGGGGLSVSFDDSALRARYEPAKWEGIVKWAVESGNQHVVQRRLTDAAVAELAASGVPLPEGLTLESYCKLNVRRVKE